MVARRKVIRSTAVAAAGTSLLVLAACAGGGAAAPTPVSAAPTAFALASTTPFVLKGVRDVTQVGQITGAGAPGSTVRWGMGYADLGSMFEANGKVYFTFGDNFASRPEGAVGGGGTGWRSNAMAWTTDTNPSDGITLGGMITDDLGLAKELLPSKKVDDVEMTVIPTYGFEAGGAMYLHWMSVRHWGAPGEWEVNDAGLAKSTDQGQDWTVLDSPRWSGTSGFVQVATYHVTEDGVDTLYVWGITHGRFGGVSLAKVAAAKVDDASAWRYLTGVDGAGHPTWGGDPAAARTVLDDTVGELSVVWNAYLGRWIMTYLKEGTGIVIREGLSPWGPWGVPVTLVGADQVAGPYAPYMLDRYTANGGKTIYFTLSIWDPYEVFWYRADLQK
ncbi:MAG: carbohydrate-binding protein [Cellulomonas sp. 73-92]|nr:MAG: carbohydrate-binding protein [Cellulomonas sp. 73-92]